MTGALAAVTMETARNTPASRRRPPPRPGAAIADVGYGGEFAAGHVYEAARAQDSRRHCRNQTATAGPYCVYDVKRRRAMHPGNCAHRAHMRLPQTDIVNMGAGKIPIAGAGLLSQCENMNLIVKRQTADQGDKRRDNTVFPRSIDAPRNH
jgi:hypothetical protein